MKTRQLLTCGILTGPAFIVLSIALQSWAGVIVALSGAAAFGWVAAMAARLRAELATG